MTDYPGANRSQWFQDKYPGASMTPNVIVLHTTEGSSWPGYEGGATAPTMTVMPDAKNKRLHVRQHFPLEKSARALVNKAGGVDTNTANAIQIELVGTCTKTGPGMFWPNAPEWAYVELGKILGGLHKLFPGIPLTSGLRWLSYPDSYGSQRGQRMSFAQWRSFKGVCGHQHVPENDHGDPGALPIDKILGYAKGSTTAPQKKRELAPPRTQAAARARELAASIKRPAVKALFIEFAKTLEGGK